MSGGVGALIDAIRSVRLDQQRHSRPATVRTSHQRAYHGRMTEQCDVAIVGGGLVGMSLAASLEASDLSVLHIEAQAPVLIEQSWDERHFALGKASVERLQLINAWPDSLAGTPIREVHVSRAGEFGRVLLRASDMGMQAFGATVPARQLVAALEQRLAQCVRVRRWRPARLLQCTLAASHVDLRVAMHGCDHSVRCKLIVAADGSESAIRTAREIPLQRVDYQQTAIVCAAEVEKPHLGRAFERFTDDGPVALLPLNDNRCGVVCTLSAAAAGPALALGDADFARLLQAHFGHRLGRIVRVGRRQPWPLRLVLSERVVDQRLVLIGNAAQTIHPIGAQGFNLGLRDASTLAACLRQGSDPGAEEMLLRYAQEREADRTHTIAMSAGMLRLSASSGPVLQGLRTMGMALIDRVPALARMLAQSAMGYRTSAT